MKKLLVFVLALSALSCSDESSLPSCDFQDPTKDLPWLKADIEEWQSSSTEITKYFYVSQGLYDGGVVFLYLNCCPVCDTTMPVFNCKGDTLDITPAQVSDQHIVWHPDDFQCTFR